MSKTLNKKSTGKAARAEVDALNDRWHSAMGAQQRARQEAYEAQKELASAGVKLAFAKVIFADASVRLADADRRAEELTSKYTAELRTTGQTINGEV